MLQSLRENMKGPVAKVIIGLAVAAMVLFGVESLFVNSMSGSEVATVNGEEVSGGTGASPAEGYLCLESEGAPVEFKNIRIRLLP